VKKKRRKKATAVTNGGKQGEWVVVDEEEEEEEEREEKGSSSSNGGGGGVLLPPSTMATCSADNTIRLWVVGNTGAAARRNPNPYSKELLHTLHMDDDSTSTSSSSKGLKEAVFGGRKALSSGLPDPELPSRPFDPSYSPRSLAFHPLGRELAVGDRQGNIRIYHLLSPSGPHMKMIKTAHDAEVLSCDYSPVLYKGAEGEWSASGGSSSK